jgi:integrase/recombinase XerD
MSLGKQAKVLSKQQQDAVLAFLKTTRQPLRNRVIFLLSVRAGLRAKEIASLTWDMVCNASNELSDAISLQDVASKGRSGGVIWLNKELKDALIEYRKSLKSELHTGRVVQIRKRDVDAQMIVNLFWNWYKRLGFSGCSSHSGRRTFITAAAKKISSVGGSIRDVQFLARHSSLQMTQRYIEADVDAQRRVVQLI